MATKIVDWLVDTSQRKHKKQVRIEVTRQTKGSLSGGCYQELQIKQNIEDNLNHMAPPTPHGYQFVYRTEKRSKKKCWKRKHLQVHCMVGTICDPLLRSLCRSSKALYQSQPSVSCEHLAVQLPDAVA